MATDTPPNPSDDGDDISLPNQTGYMVPLPDGMAGMPEQITYEYQTESVDVNTAIGTAIAEFYGEYEPLYYEVRVAVSSAIGATDVALDQHEEAVDKVIDRVTIGVHDEQSNTIWEMRTVGVRMAESVDEMLRDNEDDSGEALFARLQGETPREALPPPTVPDQPPPPETPIGSQEQLAYQENYANGDNRLPATGRGIPDYPDYSSSGSGTTGGYGDSTTPDVGPSFPPITGTPTQCVYWTDPATGFQWQHCGTGWFRYYPSLPTTPPPVPPALGGDTGNTGGVCGCDDKPKICTTTTTVTTTVCEPVPDAPPPPPPPPAADEETGETDDDTDEFEIDIPPADKPSLADKTPGLPYHDPIICAEIRAWCGYFSGLGGWIKSEVERLSKMADDVTSLVVAEHSAALTAGIFKRLAKKLSIADSTIQEWIAQLERLQQLYVEQRVNEGISDGFGLVKSINTAVFAADSDELYGMYACRTMLDYISDNYAGWLLPQRGGPSIRLTFDHLSRMVDLCILWKRPIKAPDMPDIQSMWIRGVIDDDHASCLVKCHGYQWPVTRMSWIESRVRPNVGDTISLYRRGLMTEERLDSELKSIGVKEWTDRQGFIALTEFIPPYTDLIRMMVRDTQDKDITTKYGYDKDFEKKYGEQIRKWSEAQGISPEVFLNIWRAHWTLPSPTQLYEMLHRYRPDRPEVERWDNLAVQTDSATAEKELGKRPPVVIASDIQAALEANDMAPFWVPFQMGISYHPITRTDAIDAYMSGAFDESDLYHAMRDNGYSHENANRLVTIQASKRGRRNANLSGVWTTRQIFRAYRLGTIDYSRADTLLQPIITSTEQRRLLLVQCDEQVRAENIERFIKRIRRGFFVGEISQEEAETALAERGVAVARIPDLMFQWNQDKLGRYREPTARMIVQWAALNIITPDDAYRRCLRLGYNDIDARRIVYQGIDAYRTKLVAQFEKQESRRKQLIKDKKQARAEQEEALQKRLEELDKESKQNRDEYQRIMDELSRRGEQ